MFSIPVIIIDLNRRKQQDNALSLFTLNTSCEFQDTSIMTSMHLELNNNDCYMHGQVSNNETEYSTQTLETILNSEDEKQYSAIPIENFLESICSDQNIVNSPCKRKTVDSNTAQMEQPKKRKFKPGKKPLVESTVGSGKINSVNISSSSTGFDVNCISLYEYNRLQEQRRKKWQIISSSIGELDNLIKMSDDFYEHMQKNVNVDKIQAKYIHDSYIETRKALMKKLQETQPEKCHLCQSDKPDILGDCNHGFLCKKCYGSYWDNVMTNNNGITKCLKCNKNITVIILKTRD